MAHHQIDIYRVLADNQALQQHLMAAQNAYQQTKLELQEIRNIHQTLQHSRNHAKEDIQYRFNHDRTLYQQQMESLRSQIEALLSRMQILEREKQGAEGQREKKMLQFQNREKCWLQQSVLLRNKADQLQAVNTDLEYRVMQAQERNLYLQSMTDKLNSSQQQKVIKISKLGQQLKDLYLTIARQQNELTIMQSSDFYAHNRTLAEQNLKLKAMYEQKVIQGVSSQFQIYQLMKRMHEQLSLARYELAESKLMASQNQMEIKDLMANIQLQRIKNGKFEEEYKMRLSAASSQIDRLNQKNAVKQVQQSRIQQLTQQISYLNLKIYILETTHVNTTHKFQLQQTQPSSQHQFVRSASHTDILMQINSSFEYFKRKEEQEINEFFREVQETIKALGSKVKISQKTNREMIFKSKTLIQKVRVLQGRLGQMSGQCECLRKKQGDYVRLIDRLYSQLEKVYASSNQSSEQSTLNINSLILPYQQQTQMLKQHVGVLNQQITHLNTKYLAQIEQSSIQIAELSNGNSHLQATIRQYEHQNLEKSFSNKYHQLQQKYQSQLAQKTAIILAIQTQLKEVKTRHYHSDSDNLMKIQDLQGYASQQLSRQLMQLQEGYRVKLQQKTNQVESNMKQIKSFRAKLDELSAALQNISEQCEKQKRQEKELRELREQDKIEMANLLQIIEIMKLNSKNMLQIQLIEKQEALKTSLYKLQLQNNQLSEHIKITHAELQQVQKQSHNYWNMNLQLIEIIKQHDLSSHKSPQHLERHDSQLVSQYNQFKKATVMLRDEIVSLKRLAQLRQSKASSQTILKEYRINQARYIQMIQHKQDRIKEYQQEIWQINEHHDKEKAFYAQQWNKLSLEVQILRSQLQDHQKLLIAKELNQNNNNSLLIKETNLQRLEKTYLDMVQSNKQAGQEIFQLRGQNSELKDNLEKKQRTILEMQQRDYLSKLTVEKNHVVASQLMELRQSVQNLRQSNYNLQDKARMLEQQNLLLKIHRISDEHQEYNTLGRAESNANTLNKVNFKGKDYPQQMERLIFYQQDLLCLLVLSSIEVQSLRNRVAEIENLAEDNTRRYIDKLRSIEFKQLDGFEDADTGLIKKLECGHLHLMQLREGRVLKDQQISFKNLSIGDNKAKMIESYEIKLGDQMVMSSSSLKYL